MLAIICVATHYEGDPTDNSKKIYKWLRDAKKNKTEKPFKGMKFVVFALGDSSYEQFNVMGKFFNETLEELGGERVYKYGEGNAEGNHTEDNFNEWKSSLWQELIQYYTN
jgi:NADPH-ferrihemoprotein reductase